jgi:hypothetical protein
LVGDLHAHSQQGRSGQQRAEAHASAKAGHRRKGCCALLSPLLCALPSLPAAAECRPPASLAAQEIAAAAHPPEVEADKGVRSSLCSNDARMALATPCLLVAAGGTQGISAAALSAVRAGERERALNALRAALAEHLRRQQQQGGRGEAVR